MMQRYNNDEQRRRVGNGSKDVEESYTERMTTNHPQSIVLPLSVYRRSCRKRKTVEKA